MLIHISSHFLDPYVKNIIPYIIPFMYSAKNGQIYIIHFRFVSNIYGLFWIIFGYHFCQIYHPYWNPYMESHFLLENPKSRHKKNTHRRSPFDVATRPYQISPEGKFCRFRWRTIMVLQKLELYLKIVAMILIVSEVSDGAASDKFLGINYWLIPLKMAENCWDDSAKPIPIIPVAQIHPKNSMRFSSHESFTITGEK